MIPTDHYCVVADYFEILEHLRLVSGVDSFHTHSRLELRHGEDINHVDGVLIDVFPQHDPHHFEGYTATTVPKHF